MTELARLRAAIYDDEERQSLGIDRVKAIEARIAELRAREHNTDDGLDCWCQPYRDKIEPLVIIHRGEGKA